MLGIICTDNQLHSNSYPVIILPTGHRTIRTIANINLVDGLSCEEQRFSALSTDLGFLHIIQKIAILAPLSLFYVYIEVTDDHTTKIQLRTSNGSPLILYSSQSATASEWQTLDVLTKRIYIVPVYSSDADIIPTVVITACKYSTPISYFNDNMYSVDTHKVGMISMFENHLIVVFRTFENGIFVFSMAEQGDLLIAQIVRGKVFIISDFGSLTQTTVSGGTALNDGEWHEIRWIHQFDSVQLYVDNVIMNTTAPSGLYRKLDFDAHIHIGGRPIDDMNTGIETSYHGCFARIMLNNVDLLAEIPRSLRKDCQMPKSQLMTIMTGGYVSIPFSFLPFSIEFRILPKPSVILLLTDAKNKSLARLALDRKGLLILTLLANMSEIEQLQHSARLHIDVDSYTVLWLEGSAVRNLAKQLTHFHLSAIGCYRSATVAFRSSNLTGNVTLDACHFQERCLPNPCENHAVCEQISLNDFNCNCRNNYYGKTCHASELLIVSDEKSNCYERNNSAQNYHSCEEFFMKNPNIRRKNVTIDLDGGNPLEPLMVQLINGDHGPGSVKKSLDYGIATDQLDRFVEGFGNCEQYMRYECRGGAKLMVYGVERRPSSWYSTRNGQHAMQWGDAPPYSRMCPCAVNSSCTNSRMCNCDSGKDSVDEGYNPHMQLLPVMNLYLGGTTATSSINVFIGPLICTQRYVFDGITFLNRNARLAGSQALFGSVMDVEFQIRMSHAQMTIFAWESSNGQHWYQLYLADGHLIGQLVSGSKVFEIESKMYINDNKWHTVYWEVNINEMMLNVDNESSTLVAHIIPRMSIRSRTERGLSGFAGQIRNMYLNGNEIMLQSLVKKQGRGMRNDDCLNHGECIEFYDSHKCNCNSTPFVGEKCDRDVAVFVPKNSELTIPWQHPAQTSSCFRIAIQSFSSNYSLIRAKALFADCQFNLTINQKGFLELSVFDGFFFQYKAADTVHRFDNNELADVNFCAKSTEFTLQINDEDVLRISGNWSFFPQLNVWKFIDKHFMGCLMRLQVGVAFPLKDPSSSRLLYKGGIRFEGCSYDHTFFDQLPKQEQKSILSDIHINAMIEHCTSLALTPIIGIVTGCFLFLFTFTVLVCWIRNRPDGVYKTNEDILAYFTPNHSEDQPVTINCVNREYFC
ncbi:Laminin G domain protein [Dirofilaria immitis]|nr:Laminin G domain protein [Dirofilaria immitis]